MSSVLCQLSRFGQEEYQAGRSVGIAHSAHSRVHKHDKKSDAQIDITPDLDRLPRTVI